MKTPSMTGSGSAKQILQEFALAYLRERAHQITSVESEGETYIRIYSTYNSGKKHLLTAINYGSEVGEKQMIQAYLPQKPDVILTQLGFSPEAKALSENVKLVTFLSLDNPADHITAKTQSILDKAFSAKFDVDSAKKYFEGECKKNLVDFFRTNEYLEFHETIYSPVASFELTDSKGKLKNILWINLHTCQLYYIYSGFKKKPEIRTSNIFRRMMDLPERAVLIAGDFFRREKVQPDKMGAQYAEYLLENAMHLFTLQRNGLIVLGTTQDTYYSNITLPKVDDKKFDISREITVENSIQTDAVIEEIIYPLDGLSLLLTDFFQLNVKFRDVTYMPYLRAQFNNREGSVRIHQIENILIKNG